MTKRLIALILAMALLIGVMPGMTLGVYAEGETNDTVTVEVPAMPEVCSHEGHDDGTWTELSDWSSAHTIEEDGNYYITATDTEAGTRAVTGALTVNAGVTATLCLNGVIVTGTKQKVVNNGNLTICDCQKTGGFTGGSNTNNGAAISVRRGSKLNLCGGNIYGNKTSANGGAIYIQAGSTSATAGDGGILNMWAGNIYGNTATGDGGAVWVGGTGTTSYKAAQFNMYGGTIGGGVDGEGTLVSPNTAANGGGIYAAAGTKGGCNVKIGEGAVIDGNTANADGGGIYVPALSSVIVADDGDTIDGAAPVISNNVATASGGGIFAAADATVTVANTSFTGNASNATSSTYSDDTDKKGNAGGGAIYTAGTLTLTNATFSENATTRYGGAICAYAATQVNVTGGRFTKNSASRGGAIFANQSPLSVIGTEAAHCSFTQNAGSDRAGAIYCTLAQLTLDYCDFTENSCTGGDGGTIYASHYNDSGEEMLISNSTFTQNSAKTAGAIATYAGLWTFRNVQIENNTTTNNTGAVYFSKGSYGTAMLTLDGNTTIRNNKDSEGAAGKNLYLNYVVESEVVKASNITAMDTFTGEVAISVNNTRMNAGGLFASDVGGLFMSSRFTSDNAAYEVFQKGLKLYLQAVGTEQTHEAHCICGATNFTGQGHTHADITWTAWEDSTQLPTSMPEGVAGYYLTTNVQMTGSYADLTDDLNLCLNGYAVGAPENDRHFYVKATLNLTDCTEEMGILTGGNSSGSGGSIVVHRKCTFNLWNGRLCDNAGSEGGAVSMNQATTEAGGTFNMYGGEISGNSSTAGGAVRINGVEKVGTSTGDPAQFNMYGGVICDNTDTKNGGGAIYALRNAQMKLLGGTIEGNESTKTGGAVYLSDSNLEITDAVISGNTSTTNGGGIYATNSTVKVNGNAKITGNDSNGSTGGGGIYVTSSSSLEIEGNVEVSGNDASGSYGGGIYGSTTSPITIKGGNFWDNTAASGGAIYGGTAVTVSGDAQIYENTATSNGGGIYGAGVVTVCDTVRIYENTGYGVALTSVAAMTVSGSPVITGNTKSSAVGNVYMMYSKDNGVAALVTVGAQGLTQDALIGVSMSDSRVGSVYNSVTTDLGSKDYSANFFSDNDSYGIAKITRCYNGEAAETTRLYLCGAVYNNDPYKTPAAAVEASDGTAAKGFVKLYTAGGELTGNADQDLYLDLNGNDATVSLTEGKTLYAIDSSTDDYESGNSTDGYTYGKLTLNGGTLATDEGKTGQWTNTDGKRYVQLSEGTAGNQYSFHRVYLSVYSNLYRTRKNGVGFKARFAADEAVKALITSAAAGEKTTYSYGVVLNISNEIDGLYGDVRIPSENAFVSGLKDSEGKATSTPNKLLVAVTQILKTDGATGADAVQGRAEIEFSGTPYITLSDGTEITGTSTSTLENGIVSLKSMVNAAAKAKVTGDAYTNIQTMINLYSSYFTVTNGYDVTWFAQAQS